MNDEFSLRLGYLSYDTIQSIYNKYQILELNNVLEGFKSDFFTISLEKEGDLNNYELIYIGNYEGIRGLTLKSGRKIKDRDIYTFRFAQAIEYEFPEKNALAIFNTFQSQLKLAYENFGILCVPDYIAKLEGSAAFILPNNRKTDVDNILHFDILEFYRTYFNREKFVEDKEGQPKVYLMYDRREDSIKIGETRNKLRVRKKGVAEPTAYASKRVRGEWFDLRAIDLQNIDKITQNYNMIDIK